MNGYVAKLKIEKMALKRVPRWIGFADLKNPEKLHFKSGSRPNEVWVVRDGSQIINVGDKGTVKSADGAYKNNDTASSANPVVFVTEEQKMGETITYFDHNGYLPGESLFAPYENSTTSEVLESIIDSTNSGRAVDIEWPASWPLNIRK